MVATSAVQPISAAIEAAFAAFRERQVDLTPEWTRYGREVRDWVIGQLERMSGVAGFPDLLIGQSFGAGSFGRKTKEQPLDDLDVYMVMNGGGLTMYHGGALAPVQLVGSNPGVLATDLALRDGAWVSSAFVLQRVAAHIHTLPNESGVNPKGKCAYIKVGNVNVDICPVVFGRSTIGAADTFYLPIGTGSPWWKKTNPKLDQSRLTTANQQHGETLLPIIRVMKWWNDNRNAGRLKGIHLEGMTTNALYGVGIDGVAPTLHYLFGMLPLHLDQPCLDPTGLGEPLDSTLAIPDRVASRQALGEAQWWADLAAQCAQAGDSFNAVETWRRIFPI